MSRTRLERADLVNEWVGRVTAFVILVIVAITLFEVAMRYLFNSPTIWAMETSGLLQMTYIMLGGGYTMLHRGHVRVDIIYGRFSPRTQAILDLTISSVLFFSFTGALLYFGGILAYKSVMMKELSSSGIWYGQIWPFKLFVPIGTILIMTQWILLMIRDVKVVLAARPVEKKEFVRDTSEVSGF